MSSAALDCVHGVFSVLSAWPYWTTACTWWCWVISLCVHIPKSKKASTCKQCMTYCTTNSTFHRFVCVCSLNWLHSVLSVYIDKFFTCEARLSTLLLHPSHPFDLHSLINVVFTLQEIILCASEKWDV